MAKLKKIGLLGGTFDPIHNGHLHIAAQALKQLELDEVWFMPANIPVDKTPPHYDTGTRLHCCKLAIQDQPQFKLCDIEVKQQQRCYTIDTLKALHQQHPDTIFYFILGMDRYIDFTQWRQWQKILQLAKLVVFSRPGFARTNQTQPIKALFLKTEPLAIESTQIRHNLTQHQSELPLAVFNYLLNDH